MKSTKNLTSMLGLSRAPGMKSRLVPYLVALILITAGAILTVVVIGTRQAVSEVSRNLISGSTQQVEDRLVLYFEPVRSKLQVARDWGKQGLLDQDDVTDLNRRFMPVLQQSPRVSSMMIADDSGAEYMLLQQEGEWLVRRIDPVRWGRKARLERWHDAESRITEWEEEIDYDVLGRPWWQGALAAPAEGEIHWTEPYTFFTTKDPGITASVRWNDGEHDRVVAFDVLLSDLSYFTMGLRVSENGAAAILTDSDEVIGLPRDERFADDDQIRASVLRKVDLLGVPALREAVARWREGGARPDDVFRFESGGEAWWGGFLRAPLDARRGFAVAVIVPEADFLGGYVRQRNQILGITGGALVIAILTALGLDRSIRRRMTSAVQRAQQLGQYTLDEKIGEGGMGVVYKAHHAMLRRPTAIKLLKADRSDDQRTLQRFEREVQTTSLLTHPNTIAVYDYGRTPDGIFYYAMEFLEGIDLEDLVFKTGPVPADRTIAILEQICGSLEEAHRAGLIHRDIKPSNVSLCERGGRYDVVKVLDFGLVKHVAGSDGAQAEVKLTQAEAFAGSPLFMSPESINTPDDIDTRSDLYSLGALAYDLLTGQPVFSDDSVWGVCVKHLQEAPQPPSQRVGFPIPPDLEGIVMACLAKDPDDRPATAAEIATRLAACADAGKWTQERARAWWQEHGKEFAGGAAAKPIEEDSISATLTIDLHSRVEAGAES